MVAAPLLVLGGLALTGCPPGSTTVLVPGVVGLQQTIAEAEILASGLALGSVTLEIDDSVPAGEVLSQFPAAGTTVVFGTPVDLVVASTDDYALGFEDGYAEDDWYDEGYLDSWEAVGFESLYQGDEIPNPPSPEYDRGYWDGVWLAYNDGYFQAYDDAFVEGFMDGYVDAYAPDWEEFLLTDEHIEYGTGNFDDGYNDGYSEGVVLGAFDFIEGLPSDPEDALAFYREGTEDVCVPVGSGEICTGEIPLYQHPAAKSAEKTAAKRLEREDAPAIRKPNPAAVFKNKRV